MDEMQVCRMVGVPRDVVAGEIMARLGRRYHGRVWRWLVCRASAGLVLELLRSLPESREDAHGG